METKNFLFSLVTFSLIAQFSAGCNSIERRNQANGKNPYANGPAGGVNTSSANPSTNSSTNSTGTHGAPTTDNSVPQTLPVQQYAAPGQVLPVGIYLGPGAIRSFAHIGLLRAFQRAGVPIVAIAGAEWGSIVAASYALSKGANEVEWQMMKLKKEQLPQSSMLHRELVASGVDPLFDFLKLAFGDKDLAAGNIPFRCSTTDGNETVFIGSGKAREQLIRCAVLPPLFTFYDRAGKHWISGAVSPGDWPAEMRRLGAQFLIYVDVISRGNIMASQKYAGDAQTRALWIALKAISKQQHIFANMTIEVPSDIEITDFDRRRDAIAAGEKIGQSFADSVMGAVGARP